MICSDPGRLSAEAVHLRLEHRLAQRLLSRFLSQGFLHHDLSRACVLPSRDPQPKLVLLGRLSLFGQGAARPHDALITVATTWHPGDSGPSALPPLEGSSPAAIWSLLREALAEAESGELPAVDTSRVQALAQQHVQGPAAAVAAAGGSGPGGGHGPSQAAGNDGGRRPQGGAARPAQTLQRHPAPPRWCKSCWHSPLC